MVAREALTFVVIEFESLILSQASVCELCGGKTNSQLSMAVLKHPVCQRVRLKVRRKSGDK